MKFFIDTANLDLICEAQDPGMLDGATRNPSLLAKEGIPGLIDHPLTTIGLQKFLSDDQKLNT
jgi:hypothetical protein